MEKITPSLAVIVGPAVVFSSEFRLALLVIVGAVLSILILSVKNSSVNIPVGFPIGTTVVVT
jgi:hypothetical protein